MGDNAYGASGWETGKSKPTRTPTCARSIPGCICNSCNGRTPGLSNLGVRIIDEANGGPCKECDRKGGIGHQRGEKPSQESVTLNSQELSNFRYTSFNRNPGARLRRKTRNESALSAPSYFARVVSVATSLAGLFLATHRDIHPRAAKRAWIAFLGSKAATTSSTTCKNNRGSRHW